MADKNNYTAEEIRKAVGICSGIVQAMDEVNLAAAEAKAVFIAQGRGADWNWSAGHTMRNRYDGVVRGFRKAYEGIPEPIRAGLGFDALVLGALNDGFEF